MLITLIYQFYLLLGGTCLPKVSFLVKQAFKDLFLDEELSLVVRLLQESCYRLCL